MTKKLLNYLFIGVILLFLLAGLVRTVFFPKDMNYYENRYAEQIAPLTVEGCLDGSFQDSVDTALADQVNFAQYYKKIFNLTSSHYLKATMAPILSGSDGRYVNFRGVQLFGDEYIAFYTRNLSDMTEALDEKIENYNGYFADFPNVDFYLYYIEKDTDINFETNEKVLAYEYLRDRLNLAEDRMARFQINSFDEFSARFYRTDHHWNYVGSFQGYTEVMELLGSSDPLLTPLETVTLPGTFSGSKAAGSGVEGFSETFSAYRFDYPAMEILINGQPADDYGRQDLYLSGQGGQPSYSAFYGGDEGEIIFSTGQADRENILILGESFDNAILKLIASHFNTTCSVDLRYYSTYMGQEFCFTDYLKEHDITKVLLIGNIDYFIMPEFLLEG